MSLMKGLRLSEILRGGVNSCFYNSRFFLNHRGVDTHANIVLCNYLCTNFLSLSSSEFSHDFFFLTNKTQSFYNNLPFTWLLSVLIVHFYRISLFSLEIHIELHEINKLITHI